jgi:hypothetical protein
MLRVPSQALLLAFLLLLLTIRYRPRRMPNEKGKCCARALQDAAVIFAVSGRGSIQVFSSKLPMHFCSLA